MTAEGIHSIGRKFSAGLDKSLEFYYNTLAIGVWRSLVSRLVRVQEASGSNPDTPTKRQRLLLWMLPFHFNWQNCITICTNRLGVYK